MNTTTPALRDKRTAWHEPPTADSRFGFVSRYADYAGHRTETPAFDQLLIGCVCVAAAVGPQLVSEMRWATIRANIWTLHVGESGASKSTRMALPEELLDQALPDRVLPNSSTPESLIDLLRDLTKDEIADRKAEGRSIYGGTGVTFKDEYSSLLRQITNPGYMASAGTGLITLYDGRKVKHSTKASGEITIQQPCLSLVAAITVKQFANVVKPELIGGGYLARHIHQLVPKRKLTPSEMADGKVTRGRAALVVDLAKLRPAVTLAAQWSREILNRWDDYRAFLERELALEDCAEDLGAYYQRYPEQVMKLAMLLSYSMAMEDGTVLEATYPITEAGLLTAITIVEASRAAVRDLIASLADSTPVREAKRAVQWVERHGDHQANRLVYRAMGWSADEARKFHQTAQVHGLIKADETAWTLAE